MSLETKVVKAGEFEIKIHELNAKNGMEYFVLKEKLEANKEIKPNGSEFGMKLADFFLDNCVVIEDKPKIELIRNETGAKKGMEILLEIVTNIKELSCISAPTIPKAESFLPAKTE